MVWTLSVDLRMLDNPSAPDLHCKLQLSEYSEYPYFTLTLQMSYTGSIPQITQSYKISKLSGRSPWVFPFFSNCYTVFCQAGKALVQSSKNCSLELGWSAEIKCLNWFTSDLRCSGHKESFRRTLLTRVISKYKTDLANHLEGKRRI